MRLPIIFPFLIPKKGLMNKAYHWGWWFYVGAHGTSGGSWKHTGKLDVCWIIGTGPGTGYFGDTIDKRRGGMVRYSWGVGKVKSRVRVTY